MMSTSFRIVTIPKTGENPENNRQLLTLAQKFRAFRLFALKTSPGAFASTYEDEAQRGLDQTFERLKNTKATQFVALSCGEKTDNVCEASLETLTESEWLGFVVLLGPQEHSTGISAQHDPYPEMATSTKARQELSKLGETGHFHFHLNGMFVHPSARRLDIGKQLIRSALHDAERQGANSGCGTCCRCIVNEGNDGAQSLYERCGFVVTGKEMYHVCGEDRVTLRMELWRGGRVADPWMAT